MCCYDWMIQKTFLFGVYKVTTGKHLTNNTHSMGISILKNHKPLYVNDMKQSREVLLFKADTYLFQIITNTDTF